MPFPVPYTGSGYTQSESAALLLEQSIKTPIPTVVLPSLSLASVPSLSLPYVAPSVVPQIVLNNTAGIHTLPTNLPLVSNPVAANPSFGDSFLFRNPSFALISKASGGGGGGASISTFNELYTSSILASTITTDPNGWISTPIINLSYITMSNTNESVALGEGSGLIDQGTQGIAIGYDAGNSNQGDGAVSVGPGAGYSSQGIDAIAIGDTAGSYTQGTNAIAIGYLAGTSNQGVYSIAIGYGAGSDTQAASTIILNATGSIINGIVGQEASFYVAPIRNAPNANLSTLQYNPTTYEITYGKGGGGTAISTFNELYTSSILVSTISGYNLYTSTGQISSLVANNLTTASITSLSSINGLAFLPGGIAAGSSGSIQYNNGGFLSGDNTLLYDPLKGKITSAALTINGDKTIAGFTTYTNSQLNTNIKIGDPSLFLNYPDVLIYPATCVIGTLANPATSVSIATAGSIQLSALTGVSLAGGGITITGAFGITALGGTISLGAGAIDMAAGALNMGGGEITLGAGIVSILGGAINLGSGALTIGSGNILIGSGAIEIGAGQIILGTAGVSGINSGGILQYGGNYNLHQGLGSTGGYLNAESGVNTSSIMASTITALSFNVASAMVSTILVNSNITIGNHTDAASKQNTIIMYGTSSVYGSGIWLSTIATDSHGCALYTNRISSADDNSTTLVVDNVYAINNVGEEMVISGLSTVNSRPYGYFDSINTASIQTSTLVLGNHDINDSPSIILYGLPGTGLILSSITGNAIGASLFTNGITSADNINNTLNISHLASIYNNSNALKIDGLSTINGDPYHLANTYSEYFTSSIVASTVTIASDGYILSPTILASTILTSSSICSSIYTYYVSLSSPTESVSLGNNASSTISGVQNIAIGSGAAIYRQGDRSIAIGYESGYTNQGSGSIAIGALAGKTTQLQNSIAIGYGAGSYQQSANSIAIGAYAGCNGQYDSTIILNALGVELNGVVGVSASFYVAPIRNAPAANLSTLQYNPTTYEITYGEGGGSVISTFVELYASSFTASTITTSTIIVPDITSVSSINGVAWPLDLVSTFVKLYASSFTASTLTTPYASVSSLTYVSSINGVAWPPALVSTFNQLYTSSILVSTLSVDYNGFISTPTMITNFITMSNDHNSISIVDYPQIGAGGQVIAIGAGAGCNSQGTECTAVGYRAGESNQNYQAIALGSQSGNLNQSTNAIAIGAAAGNNAQGEFAVAIGFLAGNTKQSGYSIAIGAKAGFDTQPQNTIILNATGAEFSGISGQSNAFHVAPIRYATETLSTLYYNATTFEITTGPPSGGGAAISSFNQLYTSSLTASTITTNNTGYISTATLCTDTILMGKGNIAIGSTVQSTITSSHSVAIGFAAGATGQNSHSVAIGEQAGEINLGGSFVAIGWQAGYSNVSGGGRNNSVAIGILAGMSNQGSECVALGDQAGKVSQGDYSIGIGQRAGYSNQGSECVAIGSDSGAYSQQTYAVALGSGAGYSNQGSECVALGDSAGNLSQGDYAVALGNTAGYSNQGSSAVALGRNAGYSSQQTYAVALGFDAGCFNQGGTSIAIGLLAGFSNQANSTIILSALGSTISGIPGQTNSFYVTPIREDVTAGLSTLYYNASSFEITYGPGQGGGSAISSFNELYTSTLTLSTIITSSDGFRISTLRGDTTTTLSTLSYNLDTSEVTYGGAIILPKIQYLTDPWAAASSQFSIPGPTGGGGGSIHGFDQPASIYMSSIILSQSNLNYSLASIAVMENQIYTQANIVMGIFQDNAFVGISTVISANGINGFNQLLAINYGGPVYNDTTPIDVRLYNMTGSAGDVVVLTGSMNTIYNIS